MNRAERKESGFQCGAEEPAEQVTGRDPREGPEGAMPTAEAQAAGTADVKALGWEQRRKVPGTTSPRKRWEEGKEGRYRAEH